MWTRGVDCRFRICGTSAANGRCSSFISSVTVRWLAAVVSAMPRLPATQENRLAEPLARKKESDFYSGRLEHVADALASRHPDAANLSAGLAGLYNHCRLATSSLFLDDVPAAS